MTQSAGPRGDPPRDDDVRRWGAAAVRSPFSSAWGCLTVAAFAAVALTGLACGVYVTVTEGTPRIVGAVITCVGLVLAAGVRAVLLPIAYRLHVLTERGPNGARWTRVAAFGLLAVVALAVVGAQAWRRSASRLDPMREAWRSARAALAEGDVIKFDRRWDEFTAAATSAKHVHRDLAVEIDDYVRASDADAERLLDEAWPLIEARLDCPRALHALTRNDALRDAASLGGRLRAFESDLRARGVLADVRIEGKDDADAWRDAVLATLRASLPDALLFTAWPLVEPPSPGFPAIRVWGVVDCVVLKATRSDDVEIAVPMRLSLLVSVEGERYAAALRTGEIVVGPLSLEDPKEEEMRRQYKLPKIEPLWTSKEAHELRDAKRARLKEMLSAALSPQGGAPAETPAATDAPTPRRAAGRPR